MTNEERHIAVLNRLLENMNVFDSIQPTEERKKAIKAAIQALSQQSRFSQEKSRFSQEVSQQPCDDVISRSELMNDVLTNFDKESIK